MLDTIASFLTSHPDDIANAFIVFMLGYSTFVVIASLYLLYKKRQSKEYVHGFEKICSFEKEDYNHTVQMESFINNLTETNLVIINSSQDKDLI